MLTEDGRLNRDGSHGDVIQDINGLKVAGYSDPFERRAGENFKDRYEPTPTPAARSHLTPVPGSGQKAGPSRPRESPSSPQTTPSTNLAEATGSFPP